MNFVSGSEDELSCTTVLICLAEVTRVTVILAFAQDYIPVNTLDEVSLKLPVEPPSLKTLGFIHAASVPRQLYMDDTYVVMPEPGSNQSAGAIANLAGGMQNLKQVG